MERFFGQSSHHQQIGTFVKELPGNLRKGFMAKHYMHIDFVNTINDVYSILETYS